MVIGQPLIREIKDEYPSKSAKSLNEIENKLASIFKTWSAVFYIYIITGYSKFQNVP